MKSIPLRRLDLNLPGTCRAQILSVMKTRLFLKGECCCEHFDLISHQCDALCFLLAAREFYHL